MKYLLLFLLFSDPVYAASGSGNINNTITPGASSTTIGLTNPSDPTYQTFTIACTTSGTNSGGTFFPCIKNGTAYQVTAAVKAYCYQIWVSSSAATNFQMVTATAAITANAATITGGVYQGGGAAMYVMQNSGIAPVLFPGMWVASASTFVGMQTSAATLGIIIAQCYEK